MASNPGINKYKMDHRQRGIALVINIQKFDPTPFAQKQLEERVWSIKDVESLRKTFEYLEFDFQLLEDLKANEIITTIQGIASIHEYRTDVDCFVCVVMSHGGQDKIMASDNKEVSFEEIMAPIKSCKSLIGKPKLFFFQSCRGKNEMETIAISSTSKTSSQSLKLDSLNKTDANPFSNTNNISILEYESDLFIFYSTLPNHSSFAFHDLNKGTYFIQSVCEVFNQAYMNLPNNLSLSQMITKINEKVKEEGLKLGEQMQLADPRTTLTKELYFVPKNVSVFIFLLKHNYYRVHVVTYFQWSPDI
jgi:caspase 6